jgi:aldehyde:ferredoxin oxidoreductase
VHNFQYGKHPDTKNIASWVWDKRFTQGIPDGCWYGCTMACAKGADGHVVKTGPYKGDKVTVDGPEYETPPASAPTAASSTRLAPRVNFYCDTYGIDTISFGTTMRLRDGVLRARDPEQGADRRPGPDAGATPSAREMLHQMARGEGFGVIAGQGVKAEG